MPRLLSALGVASLLHLAGLTSMDAGERVVYEGSLGFNTPDADASPPPLVHIVKVDDMIQRISISDSEHPELWLETWEFEGGKLVSYHWRPRSAPSLVVAVDLRKGDAIRENHRERIVAKMQLLSRHFHAKGNYKVVAPDKFQSAAPGTTE